MGDLVVERPGQREDKNGPGRETPNAFAFGSCTHVHILQLIITCPRACGQRCGLLAELWPCAHALCC